MSLVLQPQHTHRHGGEEVDLVQVAKWDITGAGSACSCDSCSGSCFAVWHQPLFCRATGKCPCWGGSIWKREAEGGMSI